jgi:hypothetical protein
MPGSLQVLSVLDDAIHVFLAQCINYGEVQSIESKMAAMGYGDYRDLVREFGKDSNVQEVVRAIQNLDLFKAHEDQAKLLQQSNETLAQNAAIINEQERKIKNLLSRESREAILQDQVDLLSQRATKHDEEMVLKEAEASFWYTSWLCVKKLWKSGSPDGKYIMGGVLIS